MSLEPRVSKFRREMRERLCHSPNCENLVDLAVSAFTQGYSQGHTDAVNFALEAVSKSVSTKEKTG
jgi:hypothetical protein